MRYFLATLLALFPALPSCVNGCGDGYSDGIRTGVVLKVSRKGVFMKSYEGVLDLGGMTIDGEGHAVRNLWSFSVSDPGIASQVAAAAESGKRVSLVYKQWLLSPASIDTDYDVTEVR